MNPARGRVARGAAMAIVATLGMASACNRHTVPPGSAGLPHVARFDFTLKDVSGNDVTLAQFKGHPVLINFWSTTCGPCMDELPDLVDVSNQYRAQGLVVLGISIDDSASELRQFLASHQVPYRLLLGAGHDDLLDAYEAADAIPVSWFIKRDGTVSEMRLGRATRAYFDDQVRALF